jgi:hypothetical protein
LPVGSVLGGTAAVLSELRLSVFIDEPLVADEELWRPEYDESDPDEVPLPDEEEEDWATAMPPASNEMTEIRVR